MKQFLVFLLILLSSCNRAQLNTVVEIDSSNIKTIFNKPLNLVVFWTTWCGVSKSIIRETYSVLQADSSKYNIILICGNYNPQYIDSFFAASQIRLDRYVLRNSSDIFPLFDRKHIKSFISDEFTNIDSIKLKGNFGIPISILVDSSLKVLQTQMPQDTSNIREVIASYLQ